MNSTEITRPPFTCPSFCNVETPWDHIGWDSGDLTEVLHIGWSAGINVLSEDRRTIIGYDAELLAYALPDGSPGRPFLRVSDDEMGFLGRDQSMFFDLHDTALITELAGVSARSTKKLTELVTLQLFWERARPDAARTKADRYPRGVETAAAERALGVLTT
ncbi:hypothetical protein AB0K89_05335 [Streptomyces cinnamoneus]|uniref:hypothetical protein n=1 Tax=Streptomyces cinnamoneus TaxID=53446 RepID=UPI00342271E7